ncbi:MAG: MBL fold metallo-hydrolase [Planctomycetes bacterium]|nr:MBL fold metallo-hydrolase [Planctomycetota bacterium]
MNSPLQLTVLGSGTAVPVPDRFPAGYLVAAGHRNLLVDCGPGILRRLAQAGVTLHRLDAVLLTHYHTDHCADLAALLFALRSPHFAGRAPMHVYGAPGLQRLVGTLTEAWPWLQPRGFELVLHEVTGGAFTAAGIAVTAVPIRHTAQSLGYRLTHDGASLAFSGDADECDELVDLARGTDVFVCEAATPDGQKIDGHLTPSLTARYAARAGTKRLVLTHFYPECEGHDLAAQASTQFAGEIVLANDLLTLPVGRP